jgi:hypothetical protein
MSKLLLTSATALALFAGANLASAQTAAPQGAPGTNHAQTSETGHGKAARRHESGARDQAQAVQGQAQQPTTGRESGASQRRAQGEGAGRAGTSQRRAQQQERRARGEAAGGASAQNRINENRGNENRGNENRSNAGQEHNRQTGAATSREGAASRGGAASSGQVGESRGAAGNISLSAEQRTRIRSAIMGEHIQPAPNANFNVSVGTVVPSTVVIHPLPAQIVGIEPTWRGFEFFLVGNEIVIVNPATLRIVAVVPV